MKFLCLRIPNRKLVAIRVDEETRRSFELLLKWSIYFELPEGGFTTVEGGLLDMTKAKRGLRKLVRKRPAVLTNKEALSILTFCCHLVVCPAAGVFLPDIPLQTFGYLQHAVSIEIRIPSPLPPGHALQMPPEAAALYRQFCQPERRKVVMSIADAILLFRAIHKLQPEWESEVARFNQALVLKVVLFLATSNQLNRKSDEN